MKNLVPKLLAGYKRWLSPQLPAACRFTPSCSEYAAEAVLRHGMLRGVLLASWRLLRCHPLGGRGLDPVPEPGSPTSLRLACWGREHLDCGRALIAKLRAARHEVQKLLHQGTEAPAHAHRAHNR